MTLLHPNHPEVIGLLPAAGTAERLAPIPCSKELLPLGFAALPGKEGVRPKVASHYLLEKMQAAGVTKAFVVLRRGKWDIPAYFGDGALVGLDLGYVIMSKPFGVPYTLDAAYPFVRHAVVAFGFPDILFEDPDPFSPLLERLRDSRAAVVLGLFGTDRPHCCDMVEADETGRVRDLVINPRLTSLRHTWCVAVWQPEFTRFLHDHLLARADDAYRQERELTLGAVLRHALKEDLRVESVAFPGRCVDIGTPAQLQAVLHAQATSTAF